MSLDVPADLTIFVRYGRVWLSSQGETIEWDYAKSHLFDEGAIPWTRVLLLFEPLLRQLRGSTEKS